MSSWYPGYFGADCMADDMTNAVFDALDSVVDDMRERRLIRQIDEHYDREFRRINGIWRSRIEEVSRLHERDRAALERAMQDLNCAINWAQLNPRALKAIETLNDLILFR